jgi:predicted RNA-binding protein with PUA-like domain
MPAFWLMKSEPETYSWQRLCEEGQTLWEGVRNHQAKNNLKAMKVGDIGLFYHSVSDKSIVGLCRVVQEHYPDPTAVEELPEGKPNPWVVVNVVPLASLPSPITLATIKATPALEAMALLKQSRLSVAPVTAEEFELLCGMGQLDPTPYLR